MMKMKKKKLYYSYAQQIRVLDHKDTTLLSRDILCFHVAIVMHWWGNMYEVDGEFISSTSLYQYHYDLLSGLTNEQWELYRERER